MNENKYYPEVWQVVPTDSFEIYAYMNDGAVHLFDAKPLIRNNTVFAPLADIAVFKKTATVLNHTAAWDIAGNRNDWDCIDIDPFTLFEASVVEDPLRDAS